jgi:hypothetical protein
MIYSSTYIGEKPYTTVLFGVGPFGKIIDFISDDQAYLLTDSLETFVNYVDVSRGHTKCRRWEDQIKNSNGDIKDIQIYVWLIPSEDISDNEILNMKNSTCIGVIVDSNDQSSHEYIFECYKRKIPYTG